MEFDFTWALLALPVAFALGWLASRLDLRQWRTESRHTPKPFFKGLNHLLNAQEDEAIDAFIQAVQQDPEATELHFALGNLFRNRGDYDRAVRVYDHLMQRADLPKVDHERALHALAQVFTRAGLLDRAEASLKQLADTRHREDALISLLSLYERTSEWPKAMDVAQALQADGRLDFHDRMAHYLCEMAAERPADDLDGVGQCLDQALSLSPLSARAHLDKASWLERQGRVGDALELVLSLVNQVPNTLPLVAQRLADWARLTARENDIKTRLRAALDAEPSLDVLEALASLTTPEGDTPKDQLYLAHLQREPSLVAAQGWLQQAHGEHSATPMPKPVSQALARACAPLRRYRCAACGFETSRHFWQCPGCQSWDSYPMRRVDEL